MIDQKAFMGTALALNKEAFIVHMAYLGAKMVIRLTQKSK